MDLRGAIQKRAAEVAVTPREAWTRWAEAHPPHQADSVEANVEERGITEADGDLYFETCLAEARSTYDD